jgi:RNase P subunit RPR2
MRYSANFVDVIVKCDNCRSILHINCELSVNSKNKLVVYPMSLPITGKGSHCPKCGAVIKIQASVQYSAAGAKVVRQPK